MIRLPITDALLEALHARTVMPGYNCPAPSGGRYGWLRSGDVLTLHGETLRIEQNCGLYGGPYRPLVGGVRYSGLCSIGAFSYSYSALPEGLQVGRYGSISSGLRFLDSHHPLDWVTSSAVTFRPHNQLFAAWRTPALDALAAGFDVHGGERFPTIGHDVWIGADVTLAMGIRIGHGAVIASGSVVTRDVPAYAVVAGNPAQVRRMRFDDDVVTCLQACAWWQLDPRFVLAQDLSNPVAFCETLLREAGQVPPFEPDALDLVQIARALAAVGAAPADAPA